MTAFQRLVELQSPKYNYIHYIKRDILFDSNLSETLESLESRTLDEIFWLYEQITLRDRYKDAYDRDEKYRARLEGQDQGVN